nr:hypothetical protein [Tanacetum cinerariifolium]
MFGDQRQPSLFEDQSLHVSGLSRLCAQAQSGDNTPFHKQAFMKYTQWVFSGGNFLDKIPRECLSIIESKSKVRYSRSRVTDVRANANDPLCSSSHSNSFDLQQIAAALEDKLDIRMDRFEKSLNEIKNSLVTPTAPLKAVTEKQDEFQNQMMQFMQNLYNKPSTSSSLPSNTIPNPNEEAKAITTRSGMSYKEPPIPPSGVNQQEPVEETTDTESQNSDDIHPPIVQAKVQVDKPAEEPEKLKN